MKTQKRIEQVRAIAAKYNLNEVRVRNLGGLYFVGFHSWADAARALEECNSDGEYPLAELAHICTRDGHGYSEYLGEAYESYSPNDKLEYDAQGYSCDVIGYGEMPDRDAFVFADEDDEEEYAAQVAWYGEVCARAKTLSEGEKLVVYGCGELEVVSKERLLGYEISQYKDVYTYDTALGCWFDEDDFEDEGDNEM